MQDCYFDIFYHEQTNCCSEIFESSFSKLNSKNWPVQSSQSLVLFPKNILHYLSVFLYIFFLNKLVFFLFNWLVSNSSRRNTQSSFFTIQFWVLFWKLKYEAFLRSLRVAIFVAGGINWKKINALLFNFLWIPFCYILLILFLRIKITSFISIFFLQCTIQKRKECFFPTFQIFYFPHIHSIKMTVFGELVF